MAKLMQKNHKNHKSQNFFKNNILSDSLLIKYTLQIRLRSLHAMSLQNTLIVVAWPDRGASNDIRLTFGVLTFVVNCLFMHGSWVGQWRTE